MSNPPTRDEIDAAKRRILLRHEQAQALHERRARTAEAQRLAAAELRAEAGPRTPTTPAGHRPVYLDEWVTDDYQASLRARRTTEQS